jgi:hypothetical protein
MPAADAFAQRGGGHVGGGHVSAPIVPRPIVPRVPYPPHTPFRFRPYGPFRPFFYTRGFVYFGAPWRPSCHYLSAWNYQCYGFPYYVPPVLENYGEYYGDYYGPAASTTPVLCLKDGTVYYVTDYWVVDGQLHFTALEEGGMKLVEHVISFDDLDVQKTKEADGLRGFRFVIRNEPLEQYLKDHSGETDLPGEEPQPSAILP